MTQQNIFISSYSADASIISAVTDFLTEHNYTFSFDGDSKSPAYWAWIPIIGKHDNMSALQEDLDAVTDVAVIPVVYDCLTCPHVLEHYHWINWQADKNALHQLDDYLNQVRRIVNKLNRLQQELDDLQQVKTTPTVIAYRNNLHLMQAHARRYLTEPKRMQEENQRELELGIQALLDRSRYEQQNDKIAIVVGNPPQQMTSTFKGREHEVALLSDYVLQHPDIRLVSVVGQGGVGKTALACYALESLSYHPQIDMILYLSAEDRNQQFSLETLFMMTGEAIGGETQDMLNRIWNNDKMMIDARIDYLLDEYVERRVLILFDNLEDSMTSDGAFVDDDFTQFIRQFLARTHQATIILTSRVALSINEAVAQSTRIIPLDQGLSHKFARELLYEHDNDVCTIYASMPEDILNQIIEMTNGYPRALEAVTGLLFNDPQMTVQKLLEVDIADVDDIVSFWVDKAESVLDNDQRMVMQALAIFSRPVTATAVRFLLEPYLELTAIDIKFTIDRLQRGRFITVNRTTGDISMHPLDKAYNYDLIKEGSADVGRISAGERFLRQMNILPPMMQDADDMRFTRVTLEKRAGDFYAQLRGDPSEWQTIADLQPYFLEYEHRVRAMDYETSFTMLITIYNLLKLSGFSRKLVEMISPLIEHLSDTYLMTCYNMLGMAYDDLGRYKDALDCHVQALPLAREEGNRPAEAAHLSGIGLQYSNLGEYDRALEHYEQALEISRETGKRKQERGILNNMAVVYNSIGRKLEGLHYYEESLEIAREIDDQQGAAVTLANIGDSYGALGNIEKTVDCYQESIDIYMSIGDKLGRGVTVGKMGNAAIMLGSYDDALKLLNVAVNIAQAVGNQMWEVLHQADIAAVHAHKGDLSKGLDLLEKIIPQAQAVGSPILINYTHSLLAGILLYDDQLDRARTASEVAIKYVNPANRHYEYALYGLILTRLERYREAQDAFNSALDHAAELLGNTPDLYSPKYSRGLSLMGLALVTDDMSYAEDARDAYIEARANCDATGIITREMRKLKILTGTLDDDDDPALLSPPDDIDDT